MFLQKYSFYAFLCFFILSEKFFHFLRKATVPVESTLKAIKKWGSEEILFGSDNPIDGKDTYLHNKTGDRSLYQQYFNEFQAMVSKEDYENIMYKNAERLFGIKIWNLSFHNLPFK